MKDPPIIYAEMVAKKRGSEKVNYTQQSCDLKIYVLLRDREKAILICVVLCSMRTGGIHETFR